MAAKSPQAIAKKAAYSKQWFLSHPEKKAGYGAKSLPKLKAKLRSDRAYRALTLWRAARSRAKRDGLEFSLTVESVAYSLELGVCEATGLYFVFDYEGERHPFCPSIDRRDNSRGYTEENSRVVLWAFNAACGPWGEEVLKQIVFARWPRDE